MDVGALGYDLILARAWKIFYPQDENIELVDTSESYILIKKEKRFGVYTGIDNGYSSSADAAPLIL